MCSIGIEYMAKQMVWIQIHIAVLYMKNILQDGSCLFGNSLSTLSFGRPVEVFSRLCVFVHQAQLFAAL